MNFLPAKCYCSLFLKAALNEGTSLTEAGKLFHGCTIHGLDMQRRARTHVASGFLQLECGPRPTGAAVIRYKRTTNVPEPFGAHGCLDYIAPAGTS